MAVRGRCKSGRVWKQEVTAATSQNVNVPQLKESTTVRLEKREKLDRMKRMMRELKEAEEEQKQEFKRRREQKRKAKEENRRKAEVLQIVCHWFAAHSFIVDFRSEKAQKAITSTDQEVAQDCLAFALNKLRSCTQNNST